MSSRYEWFLSSDVLSVPLFLNWCATMELDLSFLILQYAILLLDKKKNRVQNGAVIVTLNELLQHV